MIWIKDNLAKVWFLISALSISILWFLLQRKGRQMEKVLADTQAELLHQKLKGIEEKAHGSQEDYEIAKKEYEDFMRRHGDLFHQLLDRPLSKPTSRD